MTYKGQIKNGVVVLEGNPKLPEGTVVSVEPLASDNHESALSKMAKLAVRADLPPDFAQQHEHYVKGTPRR